MICDNIRKFVHDFIPKDEFSLLERKFGFYPCNWRPSQRLVRIRHGYDGTAIARIETVYTGNNTRKYVLTCSYITKRICVPFEDSFAFVREFQRHEYRDAGRLALRFLDKPLTVASETANVMYGYEFSMLDPLKKFMYGLNADSFMCNSSSVDSNGDISLIGIYSPSQDTIEIRDRRPERILDFSVRLLGHLGYEEKIFNTSDANEVYRIIRSFAKCGYGSSILETDPVPVVEIRYEDPPTPAKSRTKKPARKRK